MSASCSDSLFGGRPDRMAGIALAPQWSREAAAIYQSLPEFDIQVSEVRVVLIRPQSDTLKDTTVAVTPGATEVVVEMEVEIIGVQEILSAGLEIRSGSLLLFSGTTQVVASAGISPDQPAMLVPVWVGPGNDAVRVQINQPDATIGSTDVVNLTATAFNAANAAVTDPEFTSRFSWSVLEPNRGTVSDAGVFTGAGVDGVARVVVRTPNLLADTVTLTLVPNSTPASIAFPTRPVIVDVGASSAAVAVVRGQNGQVLPNATVTYTSRTPAVATISATGTITGVAAGQAVVVASADGAPTVADSMLAIVAVAGGPVVLTSLDRFRLPADTQFTVSIYVDMRASTKNLGSAAIELVWNTTQLTYVSHANGASGVSPTVNSSTSPQGKLMLAMAAQAPGFSGRVEMLRVTLRTTTTAATASLAAIAKEINGTDYSDLLPVTTQVVHPLRTP